MSVLTKMLDGKTPMVPNSAFPMVDVRDVAKLYLDAIKNTNVAGERFIAAGTDPIGFADIAKILLDLGYKGPSTKTAPNWLLKVMTIFDSEAKGMLGLLGMHLTANNSKTREAFNWTPISFKQSLIETASVVENIKIDRRDTQL